MSDPFDRFPMDRGPYPDQVNTVYGWLVTSWFGGRIDPITGRPGNHGGEDLAYSGCRGASFYAVKSGRVSQGWDPGGGGNWTSLFCDDGDYVGYGHALRFAPGVHGRHVEAGTLLGWVDSTGGSTGDHMHFAYRPKGASGYRDPHDLLVAAATPQPPVTQAPTPPFPDKPLEDPMTKPACYSGKRPQDKEGGVWGDPGDGRLRRVADPAVLAMLQAKDVLPDDITGCDPVTLVGIVDFYNYDAPGVD